MNLQEKQTHKVNTHGSRSVHDNRYVDNWIRIIHVELVVMEYFFPDRIFQITVGLRGPIGGNSLCEGSVGMLSCTSIEFMCHCDIHNQCLRKKAIVFSAFRNRIC